MSHHKNTSYPQRGFEVTLKPFETRVSEGLKRFGTPFKTIWNPLEHGKQFMIVV